MIYKRAGCCICSERKWLLWKVSESEAEAVCVSLALWLVQGLYFGAGGVAEVAENIDVLRIRASKEPVDPIQFSPIAECGMITMELIMRKAKANLPIK